MFLHIKGKLVNLALVTAIDYYVESKTPSMVFHMIGGSTVVLNEGPVATILSSIRMKYPDMIMVEPMKMPLPPSEPEPEHEMDVVAKQLEHFKLNRRDENGTPVYSWNGHRPYFTNAHQMRAWIEIGPLNRELHGDKPFKLIGE